MDTMSVSPFHPVHPVISLCRHHLFLTEVARQMLGAGQEALTKFKVHIDFIS